MGKAFFVISIIFVFKELNELIRTESWPPAIAVFIRGDKTKTDSSM